MPNTGAKIDLIALYRRDIRTACQIKEGENHQDKSDLIKASLPLVLTIAKRFINRGLPFMDLIQEGNIGLMEAVESFIPERGTFSSWAGRLISQSIRKALAKNSKATRIPWNSYHLATKLYAKMIKLEQTGTSKPLETAAAELGISSKRASKLVQLLRASISFDIERGEEDKDFTLYDRLGTETTRPDVILENKEERLREQTIRDELLEPFSATEAQILRLTYEEDLTPKQTAERIGWLTEGNIRVLHTSLLKRLRTKIMRDGALLH